MLETNVPILALLLSPVLDPVGSIVKLDICLSVDASFAPDQCILEIPQRYGNVPSQQYNHQSLQAIDEQGSLPLVFQEGSDGVNRWKVDRQTNKVVRITFSAEPRVVDIKNPTGPRVDLRMDQGGLQGSGKSFIPIPPGKDEYNISVKWDLSSAPPGTRAVWTFGEGPIEKQGDASVLTDSVYMVGKINSIPPTPSSTQAEYGFYWFGDLPAKIQGIKEIHQAFYLKMAEFFKQPPGVHRTFVRKVARGWGGTRFLNSFVMEYDEDIEKVTEDEQTRLMAHEMVHNWVRMEPEDDGDENEWFNEGLANLYSIYLPFRLKFRTPDYFRGTVNSLFMRYFTNPYIRQNISNIEAQKSRWTDPLLADLVGLRGICTLFLSDVRVRRAGKDDAHKVDFPLYILLDQQRQGKSANARAWLDLLVKEYGEDAVREYDAMRSGEVVTLPEGFFGAKHDNTEVQQEILEYGLDLDSFDERVVKGLRNGSRAKEAGLVEGDKIVWNSYPWQCAGDYEKKMEVLVERNGQEIRIKWWPRSYTKVQSWQVLPVEQTESLTQT